MGLRRCYFLLLLSLRCFYVLLDQVVPLEICLAECDHRAAFCQVSELQGRYIEAGEFEITRFGH
jgi:hypothetical protein